VAEAIFGPYRHGRGWRCHLRAPGRTTYRCFATREAAELFADGARGEATVQSAARAFLAAKVELGRTPATIESAEDRLRMLLAPLWARPLRAMDQRGEELYRRAQTYPGGHRRAGCRRAPDTHRNALAIAKEFGTWCVKRGWLEANPFADVEPIGRKAIGADKSRLTVDESRRLDAYCRAHARDQAAILTLGYLLLGARATELVARNVRDLDDGGRLLWIGATKTVAGRRRLLVPAELAVLLVELVRGRRHDSPIFQSGAGRRWTRHVAYRHVRRICRAAGVPTVAPQALRRTQATLATDAGATGLMVAAHLGHDVPSAPAVTHRAYVARDAARAGQQRAALEALGVRQQ
jgi:integrase